MELRFECVRSWPRLAWLARLRRGQPVVEVLHGPGVETRPDWFCEAAWDAAFEDGGFDRTDIVTGSGARLRGDALVFVSSGSTVDRLQVVRRGEACIVSNSLPCLLSESGMDLEPTYGRYQALLYSIVRGIDRYERRLPLARGEAELVYFDNLRWDGQTLTGMPKPMGERRFEDFDAYVAFLRASLAAIARNMADSGRQIRYRYLGTLSSGYDSTMVTALARDFGLEEVICFEQPSGRDRGADMAATLGVQPLRLDVDAWRRNGTTEVPFIAGDVFGEEVHYGGMAAQLEGRVVLTGYHGDKVWDRDTPYLSPTYVRGDTSGLALTEYRLHAGFFNCPVPYWGARRIADINRISRGDDLAAWDVGGDYTRPICRRIVEEAGVPREAFGQQKSFASQWLGMGEVSLMPSSLEDFRSYLSELRRRFIVRGKLPPGMSTLLDEGVSNLAYAMSGPLLRTPGLFRTGIYQWPLVGGLVGLRIPNPPCPPLVLGERRYLFQWAVDRAKRTYSRLHTREAVALSA